MVTELRIYFEGDPLLKPGFDGLLTEIKEAARARKCRCRPVATGGTPVEDYHVGLEANPHAWNVLLLDSDCPADRALEELCLSKGLKRSDSPSVFWMVQIMESWFLADPEAMKEHFGRNFRESAVKGNPRVEEIPKADVEARLRKAAGREYHKVWDGAHLLAKIDPAKVRKAAPNCERLFRVILQRLSEG